MQGTVVFTVQTSALGKTPGYMPSDVSLTQTWNQGCGGGGSVAVVCWEEGGVGINLELVGHTENIRDPSQ